MDKKDLENLTPEALAAEKAALEEVKEDDIRKNVISEFGFDEVDDAERIDKLVAKEVSSRKELSVAIGQKIKYRDSLAHEKKETLPPPLEKDKQFNQEDFDKRLGDGVRKELEKRDLESLEYPDDIKAEIQRVASIQNVSVKQAARDPYISAKVEAYEKQKKADEASISRTHKAGAGKKTYDKDNPPEVDMATEEGRKQWDEYLEAIKPQYPYNPITGAGR